MKLVVQPRGTNMSGQACVAMLLDVSLDQAVELVGHSRQVTTRELVRVLRAGGVKVAGKRVTSRGYQPERCLLFAVTHGSRSSRSGTWMVQWDGEVFDPKEDQTVDRIVVSYLQVKS